MYRIIDLDIDESFSADTKVDAVALVEMPAIEKDFVYFNQQDFQEQTFRVTDEISKIACKARKYKDENPNRNCGTNVGWTRSSQLCEQKPISLSTVKRMYSYLTRHKIDLVYSKSYDDGCGRLMYDAWGGEPALDWSKRIVQRNVDMDIDVSALPPYNSYPTGDTENDMLIEPIAFIEKIPYERKEDYISRCIAYHVKKGYDTDQSTAICYSQADEAFQVGEMDFAKVSFDYHDTLNTERGQELYQKELENGNEIYVISAAQDKSDLIKLTDKLGVPRENVFATGSNSAKIAKIKEIGGIVRHYDNNEDVIKELGTIGVNFAEIGERGGIKESPKAPKSDTPNPNPKGEGTAKGDASSTRGAEVSERVEGILKNKADDFNEKYKDKLGYGVNVGMLKSVYQRGVGAFNVSHSPEVKSAEQWALARVNAFLYLVKNGRPENSKYTGDNDLLPTDHPKKSKREENAKEGEMDIFGYTTRYFYICPGAQATFQRLLESPMEDDTVGMIRSVAQIADNIFRIEAEVVEKDESTEQELKQVELLVDDFYDVMDEIFEDVGYELDLDYMEGHIEVVKNLLDTKYEEYSKEEVELSKLLKFLKQTDYQEFERISSGLNGSTASQIKRRNHKVPTPYYLYKRVLEGSPDRDFCESIEDRYFTRFEIDMLFETNREFGHKQQPYSKWLYLGGPNCVHAWYRVIAMGNRIQEVGAVPGLPGTPMKSRPLQGYYDKTTRDASRRAYAISQNYSSDVSTKDMEQYTKATFKSENEKRMLYSPLMIPGLLIPRVDNGEKYFVRFTKEAVERIQRKFMIEQRLRSTNLEHDETKPFNDMVMVESWLVNGKSDKAFTLGYTQDEIPDGTWMVGYKILETPEGDNIWNNYIKTGKVKGLSAEGAFLLNFSQNKSDEYLLEEIINILNQIK